MTSSLRIGIVAGEASGDILGADLIKALRALSPDASFEGIGGPLMLAEGFNSHFPMERLSVMGLLEPLKRLPELLRIRRSLKDHFITNPPDIFIGIDSPDFNLDLELVLRQQNILTVHYVSPSVWAWRQGRIKKIAKAVDRMLTLLPFEAKFYREHNVPVTFVGHPLADQFPLEVDQASARVKLGYSPDDSLITLMPGSRGGEVRMMVQSFIDTARWCLHQRPDLKFIMPAANKDRLEQINQAMEQFGKGLPIKILDGQSQDAMAASNVVLMASGTTTLEALLLKKPMVVAYRMAGFSFAIISRLYKARFFSLPNLLANEALVPEVVQDEVRPEMLGPLILERLKDSQAQDELKQRFTVIHKELRRGASARAAEVLLQMINSKNAKEG
jgi:lipid-A-disaccharide synthase